jgi:uncharacterized integral membrane protein
MSASAPTPQQPTPKSRSPRGKGELARTGSLVILAVLITLFAVFNLKEVRVDWVFGSGKAPLIVVIVASLLIGIVLTYFAERVSTKRGKS